MSRHLTHIITIDGPSVSGKSTLAVKIAQSLGYDCLQSGMLYRALAYLLHEKNISYDALNESIVEQILNPTTWSFNLTLDCPNSFIYQGTNITGLLKTESISKEASIISTYACVRTTIKKLLKNYAQETNVVAEGRDMGSIVFPNADIKFFVTASIAVRAQRWQKIQESLGFTLSFEEALQNVIERDYRDTTRALSPLTQPADAYLIDTSTASTQETLEYMLTLIHALIK